MKKLRFVLLAAIVAIGMSSFTAEKSAYGTYHYQDATGWKTYIAAPPCPTGSVDNCIVKINNVDRQLFLSQSTGDPYLTPEQP